MIVVEVWLVAAKNYQLKPTEFVWYETAVIEAVTNQNSHNKRLQLVWAVWVYGNPVSCSMFLYAQYICELIGFLPDHMLNTKFTKNLPIEEFQSGSRYLTDPV